MEQIQQHEWERSDRYSWLHGCKHCNVERITDYNMEARFFYRDLKSRNLSEIEPACITRTINAPLREADK